MKQVIFLTDRELNIRTPIYDEEMIQFILDEDLTDLNSCLVFNGGTGLGKTRQTMLSVKEGLRQKYNKSPKLVLVESRTATVNQTESNYEEQVFGIGGIKVVQRIAFMNMIKKEEINLYDWIVIDECHGLFSEAAFAEDAAYIADWIRCGRTTQHLIFITASDEYFIDIAKKYFTDEYEFKQLFRNHAKYYSTTYVEKIYNIITNHTGERLETLLPSLKNKTGIIFFQKASMVKNWYFNLITKGFTPGIVVSLGNQTAANLSLPQKQLVKDYYIDGSGGEAGLTMADFEAAINGARVAAGRKSIRESIMQSAKLPEDIDVLLTTDTLQEGISICSHIDYIIIEGYTEVEIRQKLGRYRGNLGTLYILLNPSNVQRELSEEGTIFRQAYALQEAGEQGALGKLYGQLTMGKWKKHYVLERKVGSSYEYYVNDAAYQHYLRKATKFMATTPDKYIKELVNMYVRNPDEDIVSLTPKDFKRIGNIEARQFIIDTWAGVPLKGAAQEEFFEDLNNLGIGDSHNKPINTMRKAMNALKELKIVVVKKHATKTDLQDYPSFLSSLNEYYNCICLDNNGTPDLLIP